MGVVTYTGPAGEDFLLSDGTHLFPQTGVNYTVLDVDAAALLAQYATWFLAGDQHTASLGTPSYAAYTPVTSFGGVWGSQIYYQQGQMVAYAGQLGLSLVNGNVGNDPTNSPSQWMTMNGPLVPAAGIPDVRQPVATPVVNAAPGGAGKFFLSAVAGATMIVDTATFVLGSQALILQTEGSAGVCELKCNSAAPQWQFGQTAQPSYQPKIWLRLPRPADIANLNITTLFLSSDNVVANYFAFNSAFQGFTSDYYGNESQWMGVVMSWGEVNATSGAPSVAALNSLWIKVQDAHGTNVQMAFGGLEMVPMPATGIISFTFDDGRSSQYNVSKTKLSQYKYPATAYIIRDLIDSALTLPGIAGNGYMTRAMLHELQDYHGWEIASHSDTVAAHNLANGLNDLNPDQLEKEFLRIQQWLTANGFRGGSHLALPKGRHNQTVYDMTRRYFRSSRTTYSNSNGSGWIKHETYPPTDRHKLVVFYVYTGTTLAQAKAAVDSAAAHNEWLIFVMHDIMVTPDGTHTDTQWDLASFNSLVDYIATKSNIQVRGVGDVIEHGA